MQASQCSISASYTVAGVQTALQRLVLHAASQQESTYMTPAACLADLKAVLERNRRAAQVRTAALYTIITLAVLHLFQSAKKCALRAMSQCCWCLSSLVKHTYTTTGCYSVHWL
jgi:hypothetical protein